MNQTKRPNYLNVLFIISFIIFLGCLIFSFSRLYFYSNIDNIPEIKPVNIDETIKGEFLRVKIAKVDILPIVYEGVFNGKVTLIAHITSTNGAKFITALSQAMIQKEKVEHGTTLIFGESSLESSKIEEKEDEISKKLELYPEFNSKNFLYLQGTKPDTFTIFVPVIYGLAAMGIANFISRFVKNKKLKKEILEAKRAKIITESVSPEIAKSLMLKK
jgi:hypothetical protein